MASTRHKRHIVLFWTPKRVKAESKTDLSRGGIETGHGTGEMIRRGRWAGDLVMDSVLRPRVVEMAAGVTAVRPRVFNGPDSGSDGHGLDDLAEQSRYDIHALNTSLEPINRRIKV